MGLRFQFLAEGNQHGRGLALSGVTIDVVHRVGEEAAGPAGGIIEGADQARVVAEERVVGIQQQRCSEVGEVELVEDDAGVVREIGDVGLKVGLRLCRA